jgi:ribose transport system ATP-binding protein
MSELILEAKGIYKSFSGVTVLKDVALEIRRGEIHALMGENGAGKSTLIKIVTGIYPKDTGSIFWNGKEVDITSKHDATNLGIAAIYQELSLIPTLTVAQNIMLGNEQFNKIHLLKTRDMNKKVKELMSFYGFELDPEALAENLSIAQRQTLEILKALSLNASLIIMDEPTASLSASEAENLFKIIHSLREKNVSILYISHRLEEVYRLADRLTVLRDGERVAVLEKEKIIPEDVIRLMIGKKIETDIYTASMKLKNSEEILQISNLKRHNILNGLNLSIRKGEILGIGGLVGSGRTELLRCIFGIDKYDSGEILFKGKPLRGSVAKRIQQGFGLIPEDRRLQGFVPLLPVVRNVALTNYDKLSLMHMLISSPPEMKMCREAIDKLDIRPNNPKLPTGNLSGGNQQKVVVGKWLMRSLSVLMIDEPTAGIDVGVKEEIYKIMRYLAASGVTVILVSSDLQELIRVSERIVVLRKGKVFKEFNTGTVSQEDILMAASGISNEEVGA